MDKEIKVGDNYNGAKVISVGIQEATEYGIHGEARLPVDKRYIGRKYAIVQGEGRATWKVWLS